MSKPKAYEPEKGYMYQIFCRNLSYPDGRIWEHCDYAENTAEKNALISQYRLAYGRGWSFKAVRLPQKYWS